MARYKGKSVMPSANVRPDLFVVALVVTLLVLALVVLVWFLVDGAAVRAYFDTLSLHR